MYKPGLIVDIIRRFAFPEAQKPQNTPATTVIHTLCPHNGYTRVL